MAVTVTSAIPKAYLQKDGRSVVDETIALSNGVRRVNTFIAEIGLDLNAHAAATGAQWLLDLAAAEIAANINAVETLGINATVTLVYSIAADNAAAARQAYRDLGPGDPRIAFMGEYLNNLSNAVLASAFGITTGQAATLKTNVLAPQAAIAASIRSAASQ